MKFRLVLRVTIAIGLLAIAVPVVQAEIIASVGRGNGVFTHVAGGDGWVPNVPQSTPEGPGLPTNQIFQHASGFSEDPPTFPPNGSGAAGAISHTFGEDGFGNFDPGNHWVFFYDGGGLSVNDFDGTWNGSASFAMDFSVDFTMDQYGLGEVDPDQIDGEPLTSESASVPIFLELPFQGFMPQGLTVDFNASLQWTDYTTDGSQVSPVILSDAFSFTNSSPVLEDGNYGGVLQSSGTWGGLSSNAGDYFTVRATFNITISGTRVPGEDTPIGLGFFDQVAYDNGLIGVVPEPNLLALNVLFFAGIAGIRRRRS